MDGVHSEENMNFEQLPLAPADGSLDGEGATTWNIKCFDPGVMKPDATVLLLGKRGTGKSTLLQDLMYHMHTHLFAGIAMAPTEDSVIMFESFLPRCFVFDDFKADAVERLMHTKRLLSRMNRKKQKQAELSGQQFVRRHVSVLLDDCMYDKKNLKHTAVRDIFMNGRHEDVFFVNLQQYVMDMGPDMRNQVDYIFAMRDTSMENRIKLWKTFFGMFSDYNDFSEVFDSCTENYECMVLCNRSQSNDWKDCIYWYKAMSPVPKFRIGHPVMWYLNYKFASLPCDADAQNEALIKNAVAKIFFAKNDELGGMNNDTRSGGMTSTAAQRKMSEQIEKARQMAAEQEIQKQALMSVKKKKVVKLGTSALKEKHERNDKQLKREQQMEDSEISLPIISGPAVFASRQPFGKLLTSPGAGTRTLTSTPGRPQASKQKRPSRSEAPSLSQGKRPLGKAAAFAALLNQPKPK